MVLKYTCNKSPDIGNLRKNLPTNEVFMCDKLQRTHNERHYAQLIQTDGKKHQGREISVYTQ